MPASDTPRDQLRRALRARRQALPAGTRIEAAQALATRLRALPELATARRVGGYWAVRGELSLHALLSPTPGFHYCLPCLVEGRRLQFAPWRLGEPLQQNRYGIPEPERTARLEPGELDVVLVPLVGFDARGHRLGAGGGYYDRSFAFRREHPTGSRPLLVGIGYDCQEVEALVAEPWDVAMDRVVTPTRTLVGAGCGAISP